MTARRRSPGEGGAYRYQTADGVRYRVKGLVRQPDGTMREINRRRGFNGETWTTRAEALAWLADQQAAGRRGAYVEPSNLALGAYGTGVIDGMRLKPQTRASYVKNWRNHIEPYAIAQLPLAQLTGQRLTVHYRQLETSGRKDHRAGEGLSARTVRYIHTIIHAVLAQAVKDGLLLRNPADAATPPSAREAKAPEIFPWTEAQLAAFLDWSAASSGNHALWYLLAMTGMRRGEALSLRWRDVDLDRAAVSVRRSAGMVRYAGQGAEMVEDDTKSSKPRVVDIDADTAAVLRTWKAERGSMALALAKPGALAFGTTEGGHRNGEHVSRQFARDVARCRAAVGEDTVPLIRLHDTRHTHATIMLLNGVPVHVVSQRLGHASPMVTLTVYAHVMPGNQRDAADTFARLIREAKGA
jgi:integrase